MPEDREERREDRRDDRRDRDDRDRFDRDRDDRFDRDRDRERFIVRFECRPRFGDIRERVETIKRSPPDDAFEYLRTIIEAAFQEGRACGHLEECRCIAEVLESESCCEHRQRRHKCCGDRW